MGETYKMKIKKTHRLGSPRMHEITLPKHHMDFTPLPKCFECWAIIWVLLNKSLHGFWPLPFSNQCCYHLFTDRIGNEYSVVEKWLLFWGWSFLPYFNKFGHILNSGLFGYFYSMGGSIDAFLVYLNFMGDMWLSVITRMLCHKIQSSIWC